MRVGLTRPQPCVCWKTNDGWKNFTNTNHGDTTIWSNHLICFWNHIICVRALTWASSIKQQEANMKICETPRWAGSLGSLTRSFPEIIVWLPAKNDGSGWQHLIRTSPGVQCSLNKMSRNATNYNLHFTCPNQEVRPDKIWAMSKFPP